VPLSFEPLKLPDASLFGVRVSGAIGRRDRQRLLDLADRCIAEQKTHLILDLTVLATLGGGAAGILADLQRRLIEKGGVLVFVGASDVVCHFLAKRFGDLPLHCVATLVDAVRHIGGREPARAAEPAAPQTDGPLPSLSSSPLSSTSPSSPQRSAPGAEGGLDGLLEGIAAAQTDEDDASRRTADLVTAPYLPLAAALEALRSIDNPTAFGEALGNLLHSQDLAAETTYLVRSGDQYVAVNGGCRLPAAGAVATALAGASRPLTLLDLEDGALDEAEAVAIEDLQPDLLLPVRWDGTLHGIAALKRGKDDPEYGLAETFALELLLRMLTASRDTPAVAVGAAGRDDSGPEPGYAPPPPVSPEPLVMREGPVDDLLVQVELGLARDLARAQDEPHFWQILHGRLGEVARVRSMLCLDVERFQSEPFIAGTARTRQITTRFDGERINAFFRTLERPVEIRNMPHSFGPIRDALLDLDLDWIVGLNVDGRCLGAAIFGLQWRTAAGDVQDQLQTVMEVVIERLASLRDAQRRADFSLKLVETLVARAAMLAGGDGQGSRLLVENVRLLSQDMGLPPDQERDLVLGALLRDIGQAEAGVVSERQAASLEGAAREGYRRHPDRGADQLEDLRAPAALCDAVRHHHERYDGSGFPHGLKARGIPLSARVVAVVQAYVTALADGAGDVAQALKAIEARAGHTLDPDLVDLFGRAVRRQAEETSREVVPV
jgi:anti-anti-sigma regulatory factor